MSPAESVPSGGRFEIVVNIGGVAEAYVRARRIRGALRLEIVLKCRSREEAERVRASLVSEGFKCLPNSSRVLVIYRSYEVKKFLERHALYLSPEVERLYTSKYSTSLPIKPAAATRYRMLVESLVHVGFKEVSGRYLQIRLTYSSPERAREAAEALESLGLKPSMEGKRVVLVYRLCDVNFLADNVIDVPEGLRPFTTSVASYSELYPSASATDGVTTATPRPPHRSPFQATDLGNRSPPTLPCTGEGL